MDKTNILGRRIKEARKQRKMKQTELAYLLGINPVTLSNYETGTIQPPVSRITEIAEILGYSPNWFLDTTGQFTNYETVIALEQAYEIDQQAAEEVMQRNRSKLFFKYFDEFCEYYGKLNDIGKREALNRMEELTMIPKYQKGSTEGGNDHGQHP